MMVRNLRCHRHPMREAAAVCPGCRRPFCRECTTEAAGRMLCLDCLAAQGQGAQAKSGVRAALLWSVAALAGLGLSWGLFLAIGVLAAAVGAR